MRFRTAAGAKGRPQGKPRSFKDGKLQQNKNSWDETKLEAGFNASLELQCRETIEIRTKHFGAGFEAGFEGDLKSLKAMEIGAKQYDKEGDFFGPQNAAQTGAQEWASPVLKTSSRVRVMVVQLKVSN